MAFFLQPNEGGVSHMEEEEIKAAVAEALIVSVEAQLKALKKFKGAPTQEKDRQKRTSNLSMVEDVLERAGKELHISQILQRVEKGYGLRLDRDSIVSALSKKVARNERFVRTGKNIFALKGGK
ncbi:MAG TPA: hypothetical protein VGL91_17580 [Acidobacteriota bacterium]|jgi:hypothetical protein